MPRATFGNVLPRFGVHVMLMMCAAGQLILHAQAPTRHVLVLYSSERPFGAQSSFAETLKPDVIRLSHDPIDFVEMTVQATRSNAPAPDADFAKRVHEAFEKQPLDLVITVGGPAATFAQQFRTQLFPATPLLFAGVDKRFIENGTFSEHETAVATEHQPGLMMDSILQLLPETRNVMVVIGSSPVEKFWLKETQHEFSRFAGRVQFTWTNEMSLAQIVERSKALPPHSAIFFAVLSVDGKGEPVVAANALTAIHDAASAPIFGLYDGSLGKGIVGGPLLTSGDLSRASAQVALRILGGESPGAIRTPIQHATRSTFDARELARWNITESRLPPGSVIKFRDASIWQRYPGVVLAGSVILGLQLIVGAFLLVGVARRRRSDGAAAPDGPDVTDLGRARDELSSLSRHLMREHEDERAAVSKALHEDVGQRIGMLTMRLQSLKAGANGEIEEVVDDISGELGALAGEIVTVSDPLYQKIEILGLTAASRSLCNDLSGQHEIAIHFQHEHVPANVPTDVAIALFRVMQEAVVNAVKHSASLEVWVSLRGAVSEVRLEVLDSGVGFDMQRDLRSDCVGLVGIRERLKLVNGGSSIESRPGEGTRVLAWAPLAAQS